MDTQFAETVIAVAEEGSIAGGARRMGITPGAAALRIKAVEAELGVSLIGRTGRRVAATTALARSLPALRQIVAQTSDLRGIASSGTISAELRLGTIATASTGILPALVGAITRDHPQLELRIEPGVSLELCERVLDGALDAAIVVEPPYPLRKGEMFIPWTNEKIVLIVPESHRGIEPIAILKTERFIRYDRRNWGGQIVDRWLKTNSIAVDDYIELDALDGIVAMVSAGLGVALIPHWIGPHPSDTRTRTIHLPGMAPVRRTGLYARSMSSRHDLIEILAKTYEIVR